MPPENVVKLLPPGHHAGNPGLEIHEKRDHFEAAAARGPSARNIGCRSGPATVVAVASSPAGAVHAVLLLDHGQHLTAGTWAYVVIVHGQPPQIGTRIIFDDLCYIFRSYRIGLWKMTWEGESQLALAIDGPIPSDYERRIELRSCDGIEPRW